MRIIFAQGTNSAVSIHTNNPAVGHGAHQMVGGIVTGGNITMINNSNIEALSIADLDTIEIQDGSTATVTLGFSLENFILTDGTLNLTVYDRDPCAGILNFADNTHFILNSASGFDMTIISPTGGEYVLATGCTTVTSDEVTQLCNMTEQFLSIEDYQFFYDEYSELRKYDSFNNTDLLHDFMLSNGVNADVVEKFIKYHFLEINTVAKSLDGSKLEILGDDLTAYTSELLKSSDIDLAGDSEA